MSHPPANLPNLVMPLGVDVSSMDAATIRIIAQALVIRAEAWRRYCRCAHHDHVAEIDDHTANDLRSLAFGARGGGVTS